MARIVRIQPVESIAMGPGSTRLPDGTIVDPVPYHAADVTLDDGITIQVVRPATVASIRAAWLSARAVQDTALDSVTPGDVVPGP